MTQEYDRPLPIDEAVIKRNEEAAEYWKRRRHEELQKWGEFVVPLLDTPEDDTEREDKVEFFRFLMEAVERGEDSIAHLIKDLQLARRESTRSYYSGQLGSLSRDDESEGNQHDFMTLYSFYRAGKEAHSL